MKNLTLFVGLLFASASTHAALVTLTASDGAGATTSFNGAGHWSNAAAPTSGNTYDTTSNFLIRTPNVAGSFSFAGSSLTLTGPGSPAAGGGRLVMSGTSSAGVITVGNLIVTNLGMIQHAGTGGVTLGLAGGLTIQADPLNSFNTNGCIFLTGNGPIIVTASISGSGAICRGTPSAGNNGYNLILAGDLSGFTGNIITTDHHVTCPVTVSNSTSQTISGVISILDAFTKQGTNTLTLTGTNTYIGTTTVSAGTLALAGNEAGVTNITTVSSGATLQLQANPTNIVSGTSYALGTLSTAANLFNAGSKIQFRSDSSVTFNGGANLGGVGNGISSWDVNQLTAAGTNNTLTFAPAGINVLNSTFNVSGGNGYGLSVGPMNLISTGGTLTLNASNANFTVNGITSAGASGVTTVLGSSNTTISAAITATTSLTKQGTGILTLSGANSYVGSTLIQTGTVALASGATLASTNLNLSAGATLDVSALSGSLLSLNSSQVLAGTGAVNGSVDTAAGGLILPGGNLAAGTLTIATNLTLSPGGTLNFDLAHNTAVGGGTNDLIVVAGTLNVTGSTALNLSFLNGSPATGVYTLIRYGTYAGDYTQITLPSNPRYSLVLSNDTVNSAIELIVTGTAANLVWQGDGLNNLWDNAGAYPSWTNTGSASLDYFYDGDNVTFDNSGSNSPAINLTTVNSPGSLTVNATQDYDFATTSAGSIGGPTALIKSGSGTLILETANSYSGATVINAGTLQIGNANASGSLGTGAVTNNGTLTFDRTDGINVANDIHGVGSVLYNGTGSVTPTSVNNDYTGSTLVNAGTLYLQTAAGLGSPAGGTVVAGGAQLNINAAISVGAEPLTLNGSGGDGSGALRKSGGTAATFGGALTLNSNTRIKIDGGGTLTLTNAAGIDGSAANASLTLAGDSSSAGTVAGPISLGTGGLTVGTSGTWTLNGTGNFSGGTTLTTGVINFNGTNALGTGPITNTTSGRIVLGTGLNFTNDFTSTTVNPGAASGLLMVLDNTNGTVTTISGSLNFGTSPATGGNFTGPTSSGYLNVSGAIANPAGTSVSVRSGSVRFSGGGNYPELQVRQNTTSIGVNNGLATNAVLDLAGNGTAAFNLNGFNQTLAGLKNTVTPGNAALGFVTNSSATAATLTLDLGLGNTYTFGGHIVGNQSLVLLSGQQILTTNNTYTGNTTVNGGTLELALPTLSTNSTVTVASGGILQLDFSGLTNQVAGFVTNGVAAGPGVYDSTTGSPFITGGGALLVVPPVVGPTGPGFLTNSISGNTLTFTWPAGQSWRLVSQTNSLSVGLTTDGWNTVAGGMDGSNSITINPANPTAFYRLVFP